MQSGGEDRLSPALENTDGNKGGLLKWKGVVLDGDKEPQEEIRTSLREKVLSDFALNEYEVREDLNFQRFYLKSQTVNV